MSASLVGSEMCIRDRAWRELQIARYVQKLGSCEHLVHELRACSSGCYCMACGAWAAQGLSKLAK
eukprot:11422658-Alexandrium_andersonii.AAC.1